ncbi:M90 family metallopeptidase [Sediminitomix flava]|uniref:Peptidase n=1 Tax=Sediminitomix flava TaxID=379075 RepID=A0A315ZCR8_SEDFL|nr:M90 family metallopeptidase [Sediminitomix flava]PWJ42544.1 hypothetical protein BC781_10287 [Sediminitomix flava]
METNELYLLLFSAIFLGLAYLIYSKLLGKTEKKLDTSAPFRSDWRKILLAEVSYYQELTEEEKKRFEQEVKYFLSHVKIKGVDTTVEDLDRMLVASSAVIPIFGYPDWQYPNLKEVLIHESALNETEFVGDIDGHVLGMVGTGKLKNKMLLSKGALREGFRNDRDKKNVGIHEFVHLIDMADGNTDGVPEVFLQKSYAIPWVNLMHQKTSEIHSNESDINPYGGTSQIEFLTVASEYFFERPMLLEKKHPKLYQRMEQIFNQRLSTRYKKRKAKGSSKKVGRNDPCICGSGKKYKACCMKKGA